MRRARQTLTAYYQLGTGLPATLTFLESGPMAGLSALAETTTTPGLAAIQADQERRQATT